MTTPSAALPLPTPTAPVSDMPIPARELIIWAASDLQASAIRVGDAPAAKHFATLIRAVEHGASFAWEGGALIVDSPSGRTYRVTQAVCSCPNGAAGQHDCWHWLSYGLLDTLTEALVETADMDADEAGRLMEYVN